MLAAARAEFAAEGFHAASLNRIIATAGTSKGAVYYSFDDKADLFATTVRDGLQRMAAEVGWREEWPEGGFWSEVTRLVRGSLAYAEDHPEDLALAKAFYQVSGDPQAPAPIRVLLDEAQALTRAKLASGQQVSAVRADLPLGLLAHSVFALGLAADRWVVDAMIQGEELGSVTDTFLDMFRRLIAPPES